MDPRKFNTILMQGLAMGFAWGALVAIASKLQVVPAIGHALN
jgi:hypothetical protein